MARKTATDDDLIRQQQARDLGHPLKHDDGKQKAGSDETGDGNDKEADGGPGRD